MLVLGLEAPPGKDRFVPRLLSQEAANAIHLWQRQAAYYQCLSWESEIAPATSVHEVCIYLHGNACPSTLRALELLGAARQKLQDILNQFEAKPQTTKLSDVVWLGVSEFAQKARITNLDTIRHWEERKVPFRVITPSRRYYVERGGSYTKRRTPNAARIEGYFAEVPHNILSIIRVKGEADLPPFQHPEHGTCRPELGPVKITSGDLVISKEDAEQLLADIAPQSAPYAESPPPDRVHGNKKRFSRAREEVLGAALGLKMRFPNAYATGAALARGVEEKAALFWPEREAPMGQETMTRLINGWVAKARGGAKVDESDGE